MRIEFLTQDDPIYILPFFQEFLLNYAGEFTITTVSCCPTMGGRARGQLLRELLWLYRPWGLLRVVGRAALGRAFGILPRGRGANRYFSMEQLCRGYGVEFRRVGNPNDPEFLRQLEERKPDLLLSVACPYILKDRLLKLPPLGCINIHHAPLPRYKGMMPTFWQLFHGESTVGVTVHYMAAKVDEGATLLQEDLAIQTCESLDQLIRRSKRQGAHCMAQVVRQIAAGTQKVIQPKAQESSYFTFPTRNEIREFHKRGFRAI